MTKEETMQYVSAITDFIGELSDMRGQFAVMVPDPYEVDCNLSDSATANEIPLPDGLADQLTEQGERIYQMMEELQTELLLYSSEILKVQHLIDFDMKVK